MMKRRSSETEKRKQQCKERLKKKELEYQKDLKRYNDIITKGFEDDIPPKRANCKRKSRSVTPKIENPPVNIPKRPQFNYSDKSNSTRKSAYSQSRNLPPVIEESTARSFENKVQLKHTYTDLIKIINQNLSSNTIDIPLIHNLAPKNLEYESERFAIPSDFYNSNDASINVPTYSDSTTSNDIDFFFAETLKADLPFV